ncbi:MAG: MinD/ParA family protein, partial [Okeania sp. SIO2D1]|nr:MinD/ParA family protein [Okeania sp. SIO2D1]
LAGILPQSEDLMQLQSNGIFFLHQPNHPLSRVISNIAKEIAR